MTSVVVAASTTEVIGFVACLLGFFVLGWQIFTDRAPFESLERALENRSRKGQGRPPLGDDREYQGLAPQMALIAAIVVALGAIILLVASLVLD